MATNKPDLTRVWASAAPGGNVVDPDTTTPGKVADGWVAEVPPFEHFNFLQKWFTQGLAHNNEQGINVWDADTTYPLGALAKGSDGFIYRSTEENDNNDPISSPTKWYLNRQINIKDLGAIGDGTNDDTSAFIAAAALVGVSIYVPAGTYLCDSVVFNNIIHVKGDGRGLSIIQPIQADPNVCWKINSSKSSIEGISFIRDEADRDEGTAVQVNNYGFSLKDVDFKFNNIGYHGADNHFYTSFIDVHFLNDSTMLVDASQNNSNTYHQCSWQNGFDVYNSLSDTFVGVDMSSNISLGDKPYTFHDPVSVSIVGLYVEYIDGAGATPIDVIEFVEDTATGVKRSVTINGVWAKGVSGKIDSLFVFDGVQGTITGGYVFDMDNVAETANSGSVFVKLIEVKSGTSELKTGSSGSVQSTTASFMGGNSSPIANGVLGARYGNTYCELSGSGLGVGTSVLRTSKDSNSGITDHWDLYSGTNKIATIGIDNDKTLYIEADAASARVRIDATSQIDILIGGSQRFQIDDAASAGESSLSIWDETDSEMKRVKMGSNDSGGSGYQLLRVDN